MAETAQNGQVLKVSGPVVVGKYMSGTRGVPCAAPLAALALQPLNAGAQALPCMSLCALARRS